MSYRVSLLIILSLIALAPVGAATITFTETPAVTGGDNLTFIVSGTDHAVTPFFCNPGGSATSNFACFLSVQSGVFPFSTVTPLDVPSKVYIVCPDGSLCDIIQTSVNVFGNSYDLSFNVNKQPFDLGAAGTPLIVLTGGVQTGLVVNWSDGTSDTIRFQADPAMCAPEPASLFLFAAGLLFIFAGAKFIRARQSQAAKPRSYRS